jgi:hypothetical protein
MANVPTSGDAKMFVDSDSLYELLVSEFSYAGSSNFQAMVTWCIANVNLNRFHPSWGPPSIGALNNLKQFRGFPLPETDLIWLVQENADILV